MCTNSYIGNPGKMISARQIFKSRIRSVNAGGALAAREMLWLQIWLWLFMARIRARVRAGDRVNLHSA